MADTKNSSPASLSLTRRVTKNSTQSTLEMLDMLLHTNQNVQRECRLVFSLLEDIIWMMSSWFRTLLLLLRLWDLTNWIYATSNGIYEDL